MMDCKHSTNTLPMLPFKFPIQIYLLYLYNRCFSNIRSQQTFQGRLSTEKRGEKRLLRTIKANASHYFCLWLLFLCFFKRNPKKLLPQSSINIIPISAQLLSVMNHWQYAHYTAFSKPSNGMLTNCWASTCQMLVIFSNPTFETSFLNFRCGRKSVFCPAKVAAVRGVLFPPSVLFLDQKDPQS